MMSQHSRRTSRVVLMVLAATIASKRMVLARFRIWVRCRILPARASPRMGHEDFVRRGNDTLHGHPFFTARVSWRCPPSFTKSPQEQALCHAL